MPYGARESGWRRSESGRFVVADVRTQEAALKKILAMAIKGSEDPVVRRTALQITRDVDSRDDLGEVTAIFNAVKYGSSEVPGLANGFKYVADPTSVDFYTGARRSLMECRIGACGGDCDDHTILVGALLGSLGFKIGARAWGPDRSKDTFVHVYPIVAIPKRGPWPETYTGHGVDTTVVKSTVGWEPPKRRVLTAWAEE